MLPDYSSCVSGRVNYTDRSTNLLHAAPIKHDPYTPDSMDSPSPNAIIIPSSDAPDVDIDMNNMSTSHFAQTSNIRRLDRAVSPALLKSKLELIVRSKGQETDMDQDTIDIKKSPSDYCLHSWSNSEEQQWTARTNRCNSDVSWQRSHLLTEAWIQGKGQQGYHSFGDFINRSSLDSIPPNDEGLPSDLIIPRISIINASNFESNESSVYLHDDKYSSYSDKKLSTYSDDRTKSLSGEAFSSEKSDELCDKTDDESNRLNLNTKKIGINENLYLQNISELITKQDKDSCTMIVSTNLFQTENKLSKMNEERMFEDREKRLNEIIDTLQNTEDNNSKNQYAFEKNDALVDNISIKNKTIISETTLENEQTPEVLKDITETEQVSHLEINRMKVKKIFVPKIKEEIKLEQNKCNETNVCINVKDVDAGIKQAEILRFDSKNEIIGSQQVTRSNSVQSQNDNTEDVKLKAYKSDAENCKDNIIRKESKCQKCCCVVS